jgi:HEPN domain-containing protein
MSKPDEYYFKATAQWLKKAEDDLGWTDANIENKFYTQACFTAQQVAEKALKAFLRRNKREVDKKFKTHQLIALLRQCEEFNTEFSGLDRKCRILDQYYTPTRYPEMFGGFREYDIEQGEEARDLGITPK